jgi:general secretion pathway protein G
MSMRKSSPQLGFTLLELIVAATILAILTLMALPLAQVTIKREKEKQLRHALWEMRDAVDRYKDLADRGGFQIKVDSNGYPPTLDDLVKGIDVQGKKMRFLRRIPVDPMTGTTDWGLRSMQDDPDSDSWGQASSIETRNCCIRHMLLFLAKSVTRDSHSSRFCHRLPARRSNRASPVNPSSSRWPKRLPLPQEQSACRNRIRSGTVRWALS